MLEFKHTATKEDHGRRAGDVLARHFGCSRSMLKNIRLRGIVLINEMPSRMKTLLSEGDELLAKAPAVSNEYAIHIPENIRVLFQNDWLLALSKDPGFVVHPCLNADIPDLCTMLSERRLHPVNRLDRNTSGLVLIALNGHAHYLLSGQRMDKEYLALVHGRFPEAEGFIEAPIMKSPTSLILRIPASDGKEAKTLWQERSFFAGANVSLVSFRLLSGRTHQIRCHSLFMGCPLLADDLYGLSALSDAIRVAPERRAAASLLLNENQWLLDRQMSRQALHAWRLGFSDPLTKERVCLTDPLPADFRQALREIRSR